MTLAAVEAEMQALAEEIARKQRERESVEKLIDYLAPHMAGREDQPIGLILDELARAEKAK